MSAAVARPRADAAAPALAVRGLAIQAGDVTLVDTGFSVATCADPVKSLGRL